MMRGSTTLGGIMPNHRESPMRRHNPSGQTVWVARYTRPDGRRVSAGTFRLRREAQEAIEAAYARPTGPASTVGDYLPAWLRRYPRADRTNRTNASRIRSLLVAQLEGRPLKDWPLAGLRRRHALELVDVMLREQGRSVGGAQNILRVFSAMTEDAITDEIADSNPFKGVRVRVGDQRAVKQPRELRVWSWDEMHAFAAAGGMYKPMLRTLADTGLRIGELFALRRRDLTDGQLHVMGSAWEGQVVGSSTVKAHDRTVPIGPGCMALLRGMATRIDTEWLFPTMSGGLWRYSNFVRQVWRPVCRLAGMDPRPHEFRHSFVSLLRAAGVDDADLAAITGHSVETMVGRYAHALGRSFDEVRSVVG